MHGIFVQNGHDIINNNHNNNMVSLSSRKESRDSIYMSTENKLNI
jgi:hypothetical protein